VLVDELLGLGPLEELLADPSVSDIMVNGPDQTFVERKGKLSSRRSSFRDEEHLFQIAQRIVNKVGRRVTRRRRWPTPASRTAAASTSSSRRCRCAAPPSPSVSSPKSRSRST
jgi:Flp pilus assembly CpaF family ATPase